MIKFKKSQITIPLEIKVEVVMIVLFSIFCILFIGAILQNNQLTHDYFRKDVSLVKNSLLLLPYDIDFVYSDHTIVDGKSRLDSLGFEIDKYYTSTIAVVNNQFRRDGIKRSYINFYSENSKIKDSTFEERQTPVFKKRNGNLFISQYNEEHKSCASYDIDKKRVFLNTTEEIFSLITLNNKDILKYDSAESLGTNSLLIEINQKDNLLKPEIYSSKENQFACLMYNHLEADIYYIDQYISREFISGVDYVKININKGDINKLVDFLRRNLR